MKYNRLKRRPLLHYLLFLGLLLLQIVPIHAQVNPEYQDCTNDPAIHPIYSSWNLPSTPICAGDNITFSIGYHDNNDIILRPNEAEPPSKPGTTFIHSGICGDSCHIRSYCIFPDIYTDSIRSENDINHIRLKIEHSYAEELFIKIICPTGQSATILRCNSYDGGCSLSSNELVWHSGNNIGAGEEASFGIPRDDGSNICSVIGNPPGTGWNYCWSSRESFNIPSDNYIYRAGNVSNGHLIPTDTTILSPMYRPDEPFSSLIHCLFA